MMVPDWLVPIARTLLSMSVALVLLVSPLFLLFTPTFVRYEYAGQGFPSATRFDDAERLRISDAIMAYVRGRLSREELARVSTAEGAPALREREVDHLYDVKRVLDGFILSYAAAWAIGAVSWWLLWRAHRSEGIVRSLQQGVWVIVGLMVLIVASSAIDFNVFFTRFHEMFFSADSWTFYLEDTLIQLYPLPFWVDTVLKLAIAVFVEVGLVYIVSIVLGRLWQHGGSAP